MTIFTDTRNDIADHLDDAALLVRHFGLSTGNAFDTGYGVDLTDIGDGTPMNLSPIGAVVMTYHVDSVGIGWNIPADWNRGDYWTRYPALMVAAKFLTLATDHQAPMTAAEVIEAWLREPGRTEEEVTDLLRATAISVRNSRPDSRLLALMA